MIDEVFNVMKCFPGSYINQHGELILSQKEIYILQQRTVKANCILSVSCWNGVPDP